MIKHAIFLQNGTFLVSIFVGDLIYLGKISLTKCPMTRMLVGFYGERVISLIGPMKVTFKKRKYYNLGEARIIFVTSE